MKIVLMVVIVIVLAIGIIWLLGSSASATHRARVAADLHQPPEKVYDAIADVANSPSWRKDLKSVEMLPIENGQKRFREDGSNGVITYRIDAAERPRRFVTRIVDLSLPFGGSWTIEIAPAAGGSRVQITEDGEIRSTIFRFFARYIFGYHRTLEGYLKALGAKFGEAPTVQRLDA